MNGRPPAPGPWVRPLILLGSALAVLGAAWIQSRWVLGVPIRPVGLLIPLVVGTVFGWLLVRVRDVATENRRYAEALAAREAELAQQNQRLSERVDRGERALAEREEALRRAQRLEMLGQLAHAVAHDFNNLLTVVLSNATWARTGASAEASEALDDIVTACERGTRLTRQLVQLARRRESPPVEVDLVAAVEELAPLLSRAAGSACPLAVEPLGSARVFVNRAQLDQVLLNLVLNARDAMPGGGPVRIRVGPGAGGGARLEVIDRGAGIPPELAERVFEPFFTTRAGQGVGLGLPTVREIAHRFGGTVGFDSGSDGTRFEVSFPAPPTASGRPAPAPPGARQGALLVVEPDAGVRELLVAALGEEGEVRAAATVAGARALAAAGPRLSLAWTDARLPDAPLTALLAELRRLHPGVVVVIAGEAPVGEPPEPDLRWVPKPYTPREVRAVVAELLGR